MDKLSIQKIAEATGGNIVSGNADYLICNISADSRLAKDGDLFFPLIGENFDAHDFIPQAALNGCKAFVISKPLEEINIPSGLNIIVVNDTTEALQKLSAYYLSSFNIKKIAVTGSTGKTTTKEMLYSIFSQKYNTARTQGNFNNHIGLPLSIFNIDSNTEVGIFEMGMSEFGEIDLLAEIVRPHIGIITNIGMSHIENLGSRDNILKAKLEITNYFDENDILIVNEDSDFLSKENLQGNYQLVTTGETGRSSFIISGINDYGEEGISFSIENKGEIETVKLSIPGRHNAYNASLAIAAAVCYGMTIKEAAIGLAKMEITDKRLNIKGKNGMKIIDDTYNASPDSMKAALDVLVATKGFRKIAILADMFELGKDSDKYHEEVGCYAAGKEIDIIIGVGKSSKKLTEAAKKQAPAKEIIHYETKELLISDINSIISSGDVVLLKGSRGMAMDQVVKKIMEMN